MNTDACQPPTPRNGPAFQVRHPTFSCAAFAAVHATERRREPHGSRPRGRIACRLAWSVLLAVALVAPRLLRAQDSAIQYGHGVPFTVRLMTERSLKYLVATQLEEGRWPGQESGPGITGICAMALMASGEDPDFGPYAATLRRALRSIILNQDANSGHISGPGHGPMYHHGFATLALSEAYGVVNEDLLWQDSNVSGDARRTIGQALELAVRCTLTAQEKNPYGAWRYSPESRDADTTVSGTVLMGLLGAKNAGIEVPNEAIEKALAFFKSNTLQDGSVSYQPAQAHGDGITRTAIGTLVYAVGKRKDLPEYQAASQFIKRRKDQDVTDHAFYYRYYMAQALFHADLEAWKVWNDRTIAKLQTMQAEDGSFPSDHGPAYGTGMAVLALALNYRLLPVYER